MLNLLTYNANLPENKFEDEEMRICDICGEAYDENNLIYFSDELLCENCLDDRTSICDDCGNRFWDNDGYRDDNHDLCQRCYDYNYIECSECEILLHNDNARYHDNDEYNDTPYCPSCFEKQKNKNIHDYYYKPPPIFYRNSDTDLVYGLELEVDDGGECDDNAEKLLNIANYYNEHIYCKHDGSLNDGFEIVSHPMSLDYHTNIMPWKKVLAKALNLGYKSHDSGTCGLHIHVGRKELGKDAEAQEDTIGRILFFIERYWGNVLRFSRRTESQVNQWAARYGCKGNCKETLKHAKENYARYVSLNLQNYNTIEFRISRGTLKYSTFIACLQLVDSICKQAVSMFDEEFEAISWNDFVKTIDKTAKPELITYLAERRLYETQIQENNSIENPTNKSSTVMSANAPVSQSETYEERSN